MPPALIGLTLIVAGHGVASGKLRLFRHDASDRNRRLVARLMAWSGAIPCALLLVRIFVSPTVMLIVLPAAGIIEAVLAGAVVTSIVRGARRRG